MKDKAPLSLMEQMVMILVFALCAALCLQAFAKSDALSRRSEARDEAVILCQSAAETIRSTGSVQVPLPDAVRAQAVDSDIPGLAQARVWVEEEGDTLFELIVAWQTEVSGNG